MIPLNNGITVVVKHFLAAFCQLLSKGLIFIFLFSLGFVFPEPTLKKYSTSLISVSFQGL